MLLPYPMQSCLLAPLKLISYLDNLSGIDENLALAQKEEEIESERLNQLSRKGGEMSCTKYLHSLVR